MNVSSFSADEFSGLTRLFPLPNLVMFPYALQALHVFEPRYVSMFEKALATDRLFALALLEEQWDPEGLLTPEVHPTVCLCQIVTHQRREDSLYDTVVFGVSRARIVEELDTPELFREVRVELMPDEIATSSKESDRLEEALLEGVKRLMPGNASMISQLKNQSAPEATLSILTDLLAYCLPLDMDTKQQLLDNTSVIQRARELVAHLGGESSVESREFPPSFSLN